MVFGLGGRAGEQKMVYKYEKIRRIQYKNGAVFIPICKQCGRFVKADKSITANSFGVIKKQPNAECSKCGRVEMLFEGYF